MNRLFHARITWYQYLFLILLASQAFIAFWCKLALLGAVVILFLVVVIERIIHTIYTVTSDNQLIIDNGRFTKKKQIPIAEITSISRQHTMKIGRFCVSRYVLIEYSGARCEGIILKKEKEFIDLIEKRKINITFKKEPLP